MRFKQLLFIILTVLFFSCNENTRNITSAILNQDNLLSQNFIVNINSDTTLLTKNGCVIKIPKGSLGSDSENVKLEIKEALSSTEMVLAGLTTMSGTQTLSSGGMIYFNAASGYNISIKKDIEILVPTEKYDPDMQVYKGEDSAGKINWTEPQPLPKDSLLTGIQQGEEIFKAYCANCHKVSDDFSGPAMRGVTKRAKKQWIYGFTRNPAGMHDEYSAWIKMKWRPTIMTAFPQLKNQEIDNILAYVETADNSNSLFYEPGYLEKLSLIHPKGSLCFDSCKNYVEKIQYLENERIKLESKNGDYFTLERDIPIPSQISPSIPDTTIVPQSSTPVIVDSQIKKSVIRTSVKAVFYTINIKAVGWYNVDILVKEATESMPTKLFVNLQTAYDVDFKVSLIIPSIKAFIEGGKLDNGKQYGFDEINGNIPLPQNTQCYILATTEENGKLVFGKAAFISKQTQTIDVIVKEMSKEDILKQIKDLNLDNVDAEIKDAPNADKLRIIEKKATDAEKLKPKNCDCGFPATDTTKKISTTPLAFQKQ